MNKRKSFILFFISLFLFGCNSKQTYISKNYFSFSTIFNINIYQDVDDSIFRKIESILDKYNKLFDPFNGYNGVNNIYTINHSKEEIKVDDNLYNAIKLADKYYNSSLKDYFNPYLGEFTFEYKKIYEEYTNNKDNKITYLDKEYIEKSLNNLNNFKLTFNDNNKTIKRDGDSLIDLGAFAKGYVLNELKNFMKEENIEYYLLNGGSSSVYLTTNPSRTDKNFLVGLRYLNRKGIETKNNSIGISSIFEQLIEVDGNKYSHIINPLTGLSECNYDFSVVMHEDPILSDILSTSLMLIKDENIINKIKDEYNFKYSLFKDKKIIHSSNDIILVDY